MSRGQVLSISISDATATKARARAPFLCSANTIRGLGNNAAKVHKTKLDGTYVWSKDMTAAWGEKSSPGRRCHSLAPHDRTPTFRTFGRRCCAGSVTMVTAPAAAGKNHTHWPFKPTDVLVPPGQDAVFVADGYGLSKVPAARVLLPAACRLPASCCLCLLLAAAVGAPASNLLPSCRRLAPTERPLPRNTRCTSSTYKPAATPALSLVAGPSSTATTGSGAHTHTQRSNASRDSNSGRGHGGERVASAAHPLRGRIVA